jgi:hypothetical protein
VPDQIPASQSVQIVSDITTVNAGFDITSSDISRTDMNVQIPAISLSPIELNSTQYQIVSLPVADHLTAGEVSEEGKPDIPALTAMVIVPDMAGIRLTVTHSGYEVFENIDLAPVQPAQPESDPTPVPFAIDQAAYATDSFYPGDLAEASEPQIMRDIRFVQVALYPVQYNPVRRELRVYRDLSVSLSYDGEVVNPKTIRHRYLSDGFYPIYQNMFSNFDEIFSTAEVRRGGFMIISKPIFIDSLKALAEWKHRKGYEVKVVSTQDIDPTDASPSTQQVYNFIRNAYQTWETPPEYIMIVGDQDNTGANGTGVEDSPYLSTYASDHAYACVEGTDYLPELFIGRLSVDNIAEFRKAVSKIFKYERNPQMFDPQHWIRGLSIGYMWYVTARFTTLWVRQIQLQHGFARVDTVFGSSADPRINTYLREGRAMVQYRGAGSTDGWWGPSFYISDLSALPNNQKLGVWAILTCGTGDFLGECLGEHWLRQGLNPDSLKGGPAYYGVSDHNTHTKWNNPIMMGYYWGIFAENNYHFASAAIRGKLQQYATFPRARSNEVRLYFHTYNMLGDPELEIRTKIPIYIVTSYDDTVAFGLNHYEVNVTDSSGAPIAGAFVTLIKNGQSGEELFSVEKTDQFGNAILYYDAPTPGPMALTVSGQNLIPTLATVEIVDSDIAVGSDSTAIDDDLGGHSNGNADGLASPNETIELTVSLKNYGTLTGATGVVATLESLDDQLIVHDAIRAYGDIGPGQSAIGAQSFVAYVAPDAQFGDVYRLKLNVTDQSNDNWYSLIEIPIAASKFVIPLITITDENNRLDQGDTVTATLTITNRGDIPAQGVTAYITTLDDYATIIGGECTFGDIPVDSSIANPGGQITIATSSRVFDGHAVNFLLHTSTTSGAKTTVPFSISVGAPTASDPTGPDAYGHYMYDNTDTLGYSPAPRFGWVGIAPAEGGTGTRLNYGGITDDKSVLVQLPFDFVYFGQPQRHLIVCTNGFVALDTFRIDMGGNYWALFFNWPIPDPGNAAGQISPFWDDLEFTGTTYGVYTWNDTTNHRFVIEWYHMTHRNTAGVETFEMIIFDPAYYPTISGDAEIVFQYNAVQNVDAEENYASAGFEDLTETIGLQYTYDGTYTPTAATLSTGRAVKITTNTGGGGVKGTVNLNMGGLNGGVMVSASTGQRRLTSESGQYWIKNIPPGTISLSSEAEGYFPMTIDSVEIVANQSLSDINFDMTVCPAPTTLRATDTLETVIELAWDAVIHGDLVGYDVFRSRWQNGQYVKLNTQPITATSFIDLAVLDSGLYWYYVDANFAGTGWTAHSAASNKDSGRLLGTPQSAEDEIGIPKQFFLAQNYPNPFNPSTSISYGLPVDSHVKIEVFNMLGQRVKVLVDEDQAAGYRRAIWDGHDSADKAVASGVYLYRLKAGDKESTMKMLMLK